MKGQRWIWYPGDFEIYHGMQQNFDREERGFLWPAFWKISDCNHNVKFLKSYDLEQTEEFIVYGMDCGYVTVNGKKFLFGETIICQPGKNVIIVFVGNKTGLPCMLAEGNVIFSDSTWQVSDFTKKPVQVGSNQMYTRKEQNPGKYEYTERERKPKEIKHLVDGVLYDFGIDITAEVIISRTNSENILDICYGESEMEALDTKMCYLKQTLKQGEDYCHTRLRAFRYLYMPDVNLEEVKLTVIEKFVDYEKKGKFVCNNSRINEIWNVAVNTFDLCSGIFFIDGVKRDRWIWSGDAYQSYFVNQYLYFDEDISKRTIVALRGTDPVEQHMNTIIDYSLYWVISVWNHYHMTGDGEFLNWMYPKMESLMKFCEDGLQEQGFIEGKEGDWTFIDWANLDKTGPLCAEQMLLLRCYEVMELARKHTGKEDLNYDKKRVLLWENIQKYYWDNEKGAFIDSFTSGKRNVTRHANIFAILFNFVTEEQKESIIKFVLMNPKVPEITTPYFKFYELEVLSKLGYKKKVCQTILDYWGGMLDRGATTFWEEFIPGMESPEEYAMYGDPFGKSLCHAWGASPIYLIGRYILGVHPLTPGYETFEVKPDLSLFSSFDGTVPIKNGEVKLNWDESKLQVYTNQDGGILEVNGQRYGLKKGVSTTITV